METCRLADRREFRDDKMAKVPVFDSPQMFFDQYCLRPGQAQKPHSHGIEDKIYVVLEGSAVFEIAGETRTLAAGTAVIARSGQAHGVRNESSADLVLLVAMAPRPA
jgi:mannose-6-phosphate isomerase-like protein (cupin superfamily)